jgi:hypothetical protein
LFAQVFAQGQFWNARPPSEWSPEEIAQLTTASPWAIKTRVTMAGANPGSKPISNSQASNSSVDLPTRITQRRLDPGAADAAVPSAPQASAGNSSAPLAFYGEVVVTWESAAPIRLARDKPLDSEFDNRYALRITGLPAQTFMPDTGRSPVVFRLLIGTSLEMNAGKREQSDYVLRMPEANSIMFAFPKRSFPLRPSDRFVSFAMHLNQMTIHVRFDLRLMIFGETLAV